MAGQLQDKVALVTGGASGIGRACAERLANDGAVVVVTDIQDDKGAETVAAIAAAGGKARYLRHDVTSEEAWIAVVADVAKTEGRLDILVNNAGIGLAGSIVEMTLADFQRQFAINVDGVFLGMKHSLPLIRKGGRGGSIINMSSVAGLKGSPNMGGYCATKGAVRLITKSAAMECAEQKDGVRVNSVHPGLIETPIWDSIVGSGGPGANSGVSRSDMLDAMSQMAVPLGMKGWPQDIANGVAWLAGEESRYVTGAELVIDGGLTVR